MKVRITLRRHRTKSRLEFEMDLRPENYDRLPSFLNKIYPDWTIDKLTIISHDDVEEIDE